MQTHPPWLQPKKTRNLCVVTNILAGLHVKSAGLTGTVVAQALRELDTFMPTWYLGPAYALIACLLIASATGNRSRSLVATNPKDLERD